MGYTTEFEGEFKLDRALTAEQRLYLNKFSETRRMKRDKDITEALPDPVREKVGLPVGDDGQYYVGSSDVNGFTDKGVIDLNTPPGQMSFMTSTDRGNQFQTPDQFRELYETNQKLIETGRCQPGLWCQWIPNAEGTAIIWDGGEKFYYYTQWIKYLIDHFLGPWGIKVNGTVTFQGEDENDKGEINIVDNAVVKSTY